MALKLWLSAGAFVALTTHLVVFMSGLIFFLQFTGLQTENLEVLLFLGGRNREREERERARMEVRIQMDLPVSLFDISHI
jgi:hypothetical protein